MSADKHAMRMPPHIRPQFVTWLAKRDRKAGIRAFRSGCDHGYHDGQQDNERIS